jgi:hypothetical protein
MELQELVGWLREFDLLLDSDRKFPNLTTMLAGTPREKCTAWPWNFAIMPMS